MRLVLTAALLCCAGSAAAQDESRAPFTGPLAGVEAGYLEHHFAVELEEYEDGELVSRRDEYRRSHGFGAGLFAGHDWAISDRGRIGAELEVTAGGRTVRLDFQGASYSQRPQFGVRGVVRAGYLLTPRLMGYALTGYGGNRYRIRDGVGLGNGNAWGSSFIVGVGAEYRLGRRLGLRLDGRHVDNQTWQVMLGLPVRL